jgi:hypothetical protein
MNRNWILLIACAAILLTGCGPVPLTAQVLDPDQGLVNTPTPSPTLTGTSRPSTVPASATAGPTPDPATLQPLATGSISATPEIIDVTPPPTADPPSDNTSNPLIDQARTDLAQRLNIDSGQIALIEFRSVVWSDGSLGCPQPGMGYTQVLVEGYYIKLSVGKRIFQYHGGQGRPPFLCDNPEKPLSSGSTDS